MNHQSMISEGSPRSLAAKFRSVIQNTRSYHLVFLLLFAIVTRMNVFFHPGTITLGWRQADLSSVAANYLHNGFRLLYPQINWGGAGPGYVEMEFPLVPYLTALLYQAFGVHEILALIIPFLTGLGVIVAVHKLSERMCDSAVAFVAALLVCCSPLLALAGQTFLGEPALILCTVLSIHFLLRWSESGRTSDYVLSCIFTALAALLKLTALYVGLPLLALFVIKYGKNTLKRLHFWLFGIISLLPVVLWYYHAHNLYVTYGNTFGILSGGYNKFARAGLLLDLDFYVLMGKRILFSVASPAVFLLGLAGLFQRKVERTRIVLLAWIVALVFYTLLVAEGNKDMIYYQLPWLPALAILGSVGFFFVIEHAVPSLARTQSTQSILILLLCLFVAASAVGVAVRSAKVPITYLESEAQIKTYAEEVRSVTKEGSLIVVSTSYGSEKTPETIDTPPQMFYYSGRRGWYLALAWVTPEAIDRLGAQGAEHLVVFGGDAENLRSNAPLYQSLVSKFHLIVDRDDLLVFRLAG